MLDWVLADQHTTVALSLVTNVAVLLVHAKDSTGATTLIFMVDVARAVNSVLANLHVVMDWMVVSWMWMNNLRKWTPRFQLS